MGQTACSLLHTGPIPLATPPRGPGPATALQPSRGSTQLGAQQQQQQQQRRDDPPATPCCMARATAATHTALGYCTSPHGAAAGGSATGTRDWQPRHAPLSPWCVRWLHATATTLHASAVPADPRPAPAAAAGPHPDGGGGSERGGSSGGSGAGGSGSVISSGGSGKHPTPPPSAWRVNGDVDSPVLVVLQRGHAPAEMSLEDARAAAGAADTDLVQLPLGCDPPIVLLVSHARLVERPSYAIERLKLKPTKAAKTKELSVSCKTAMNDVDLKLRHARRMLDAGDSAT
ncbi:hypothetical protein FOA52_006839 [Chlamydomonas sp. UWO 241]|nr:hypothetical protein FOA52_006839 [Chlamydomonas sp. UWO 241]